MTLPFRVESGRMVMVVDALGDLVAVFSGARPEADRLAKIVCDVANGTHAFLTPKLSTRKALRQATR